MIALSSAISEMDMVHGTYDNMFHSLDYQQMENGPAPSCPSIVSRDHMSMLSPSSVIIPDASTPDGSSLGGLDTRQCASLYLVSAARRCSAADAAAPRRDS